MLISLFDYQEGMIRGGETKVFLLRLQASTRYGYFDALVFSFDRLSLYYNPPSFVPMVKIS